jgi:copper chaperone NosL
MRRRRVNIQRPMSAGIIVGGFIACAVLMLSACQSGTPKPLDIAANDVCTRCRTPIIESRYAAEFVTKDGFVRKFDDIVCMTNHARKVRKNIAAFYAMDFATQKWLNAEEAQFIRSEKFKTPQNGGILALKDPAKAKELATQYQAELVTFNDLMK